jgi:hypothetical protein
LLQGCAKKIHFHLLAPNRPFKFGNAIRRLDGGNQFAQVRWPARSLQCGSSASTKLFLPSIEQNSCDPELLRQFADVLRTLKPGQRPQLELL